MDSDQFKIIASIGAGATSEVFKAKNLITDKYVAIKSFSSVVTRDPDCFERLQCEIKAQSQLNHPNIVQLISHQKIADKYQIELELVSGGDLRQWQEQYLFELIEPKIWILSQILKGLGAAHEKGIIHRDLKLENVLVAEDGNVKLTDFGLAKSLDRLTMTKMGLLVGSLGYMAPEIINGNKASTASDIFSFGAIAYELLSGRPAFTGETPQALIKSITDEKFIPIQHISPYVPRPLAQLIESCLSREPHLRPANVWIIDAEIMNYLLQSEMLPFCNKLASNQGHAIYKDALIAKHEALEKRQGELLQEVPPSKQKLVDLANEYQHLFPEDPTGSDLLIKISKLKKSRKKKRILFFVILLLLLTLGSYKIFFNHLTEPKPISVVKVNHPTQTKPAKVVIPKKTPVSYGTVQFEVDSGVSVTVDGVLVPSNRLKSFRVPLGKHKIKLSKSGFIPIESTIRVRANSPTIIRAKGAMK